MSNITHLQNNSLEDVFNVIIAIDLQKQFKDDKGQYEKCLEFINSHIDDGYYILGTIFRNYDDSMFERHLNWSECKDVQYIFNGMSEDIEYPFHKLILKSGYGIDSDGYFVPSLNEIYKIAGKQQNRCCPNAKFYLIGCDADACVLATAFTLWDRRDDFVILSDYVYTTAKDYDVTDIFKIMKRNFGDCVR